MSNYQQLSTSIYHQLSFGLAFGVTDAGSVRSSNEDNFLISEELGLVMVGDGMGGHDGGEIASANALLAMRDCIENFSAIRFQARLRASPTMIRMPPGSIPACRR